jgi:AcrR family transcriptional regulator
MTEPTPKPNRRQVAKAETQAKVLAAARVAFETLGYEAATIRGIVADAGMSTGSVFANWTDKAALYRAVYGHDPITPEQGRAAFLVLRALGADLSREYGTEAVDELAAVDVLRRAADEVLGEFPDLPPEQVLDPNQFALTDVVLAALSQSAAADIRAEAAQTNPSTETTAHD